jgi:hypothetical protein
MLMKALAAIVAPYSPDPVLLDSRCEASEYGRAVRQDLGRGVTLYAMHGRAHIFLCASLPPRSLGSLDLYLQSPRGGPITRLHLSRQLGEVTHPEGSEPDPKFRVHPDWSGPTNEILSFRDRQFDFVQAREVQLSKARFGKGPWRVRLVLAELGPDQESIVEFPGKGSWNLLQLR